MKNNIKFEIGEGAQNNIRLPSLLILFNNSIFFIIYDQL
jgi:hypothetical protein